MLQVSVNRRRSVVLMVAVAMVATAMFVTAPESNAASAVDVVILGGESAVSASVEAELETCTTGSVTRLAGGNRYQTAAAISASTFVSAEGAFVATGLNFPDALAGGPPAALTAQPVLLVNDAVPASTAAELVRLGVSSVTVLGGSAVVPDSVVTSLNAVVPTTRIAGSDRYSTAAAIVQAEFASAETVYVATGLNFPDALAGVPAAAGDSAPILLVQQNSIPAATATQLSRLNPSTIKILGGEAVISAGVASSLGIYASSVIRLSGSDRYSTAAAISRHAFSSGASTIYISTGLNYPDALAGGPAAGSNGAPILLVQPDSIPGSTKTEIERITGMTCGSTPPPFSCDTQSSIPVVECEALEALYASTNGPGWTDTTGWLTDPDPCDWFGVSCSGGAVFDLDLIENGLAGTIPAELGNLTKLTDLFLSRNQLSGSIPVELGTLANVREIGLSYNQLSGPIPAELGSLTKLNGIGFHSNQLSGPIPAELGNLGNLQSLFLGSNQLSGPLPAELGNLTSLEDFYAFGNAFAGPIPPELGNLTSLKQLALTKNQLSGPIPAELGGLTNLTYLSLGYNRLSGPLPGELADLTSLGNISLAFNSLLGEVPIGLMDLPITILQFEGQTECLSTPDAAFAAWLSDLDPLWSDGC